MTDFALEQKLQLAEKTIEKLQLELISAHCQYEEWTAEREQLRRELEEAKQRIVEIEQDRSELLEETQNLKQISKDNLEEFLDKLAAQALVIEKLREALGLIVSGEKVNGCIPSLGWAVDIADEALTLTTDYRKELAERDAALLERVIEKLKSKQSHEAAAAAHHSGSWQEAYEHHMKRQGAVSECVDVVRDIAAKIRAGEEV